MRVMSVLGCVFCVLVCTVVCGCGSWVSRERGDPTALEARLKALGMWADMYAVEHLKVEGEKRWRMPDTFADVARQYKGARELEMSVPGGGVARFRYVGRGLMVSDKRKLAFVCAVEPGGGRLGVTIGGFVRRLSERDYERALVRAEGS